MDRGVGAAARLLPESDRKDLAIQALTGSETVSDLAARHGVSRKFVYQQTRKVHAALDGAFSSAKQDTEEVLFELTVTEAWLRQGPWCTDPPGGAQSRPGVGGCPRPDPGCPPCHSS
jgi:transposase-like protein